MQTSLKKKDFSHPMNKADRLKILFFIIWRVLFACGIIYAIIIHFTQIVSIILGINWILGIGLTIRTDLRKLKKNSQAKNDFHANNWRTAIVRIIFFGLFIGLPFVVLMNLMFSRENGIPILLPFFSEVLLGESYIKKLGKCYSQLAN